MNIWLLFLRYIWSVNIYKDVSTANTTKFLRENLFIRIDIRMQMQNQKINLFFFFNYFPICSIFQTIKLALIPFHLQHKNLRLNQWKSTEQLIFCCSSKSRFYEYTFTHTSVLIGSNLLLQFITDHLPKAWNRYLKFRNKQEKGTIKFVFKSSE